MNGDLSCVANYEVEPSKLFMHAHGVLITWGDKECKFYIASKDQVW